MAHFARIDDDGNVQEVIVIEQEEIDTGRWGDPSKWIQTSYNTHNGVHLDPETGEPSADQTKALRWNFAGVGMVYDSEHDAFYWARPWDSWTLNAETFEWEPPVANPGNYDTHYWDEETLSWIER